MAQLQTQSAYITQQIAAWNANAKLSRAGAAGAVGLRRGLISRRQIGALRGFKSAGAIPILQASPHREDHRFHVRPRRPVPQRLQRLRRRLPHGRRRDRRRRGLAAPARDHAVRRLRRRDRRGPRWRSPQGQVEAKCKALGRAAPDRRRGPARRRSTPAGGSLAENLLALYGYVSLRLTQANLNNDVAALDECVKLLEPVRSAWLAIGPAAAPPAPLRPNDAPAPTPTEPA